MVYHHSASVYDSGHCRPGPDRRCQQMHHSGRTAEKDRWVRGVFTFTTLAELDTTGSVIWYIYGCSGTGKVYMCNPKLELGNTSTSISLNSTEGYVESSHGFSEIGLPNTKFFENTIEAIDFIEY